MKSKKIALGLIALVVAGALFILLKNSDRDQARETPAAREYRGGAHTTGLSSTPVPGRDPLPVEEIDPLALERLEEAIETLRFPSDPSEARKMLTQELEHVLAVPDLWNRWNLLSELSKRFSISALESSGSAHDYIARMDIFREVIGASKDKLDGRLDEEVALIDAVKAGVAGIEALPESSRESWKRDLIVSRGEKLGEMAARLLAALTLQEHQKAAPENFFDLTRIDDPRVRGFAEREMFRTSDFTTKSEAHVRSAAAFFLGPESQVSSDHEIFVRLFGLGTVTYPEAVSAEVLKAPRGMKRDLAIEQMIFRIAPDDLENARLWYAEIDDPAVKQRAELDISGRRVREARPAASDVSDPFAR